MHVAGRIRSPLAVIITIILLGGLAFGQSPQKLGFSVSSGMSFVSEPEFLRAMYETGFNVGLGISHPFAPLVLGRMSIDYNRFNLAPGFLGSVYEGGETMTITTVAAGFKVTLPFSGDVRPYFCDGISFSMIRSADIYESGGMTIYGYRETPFGLWFGAGFDVVLTSRADFFVEAAYAISFSSSESIHHVPIKLGLWLRPKSK